MDWSHRHDAQNRLFFKLDPTMENAQLFHDRIADLARENEHAGCVDVHTPEEYLDDDLYLAENGRSGFAIRNGDELVSVFSYRGEHAGDAVVAKAVEQGARRLDCYDVKGRLPALYSAHGFRTVARVKWDDRYAPHGWDYDRLGRPDVCAMAVMDEPDPNDPPYTDYDTAVTMAKRAAGTDWEV